MCLICQRPHTVLLGFYASGKTGMNLHLLCSQPGTSVELIYGRFGKKERRDVKLAEYLKKMEENAVLEQKCWAASKNNVAAG